MTVDAELLQRVRQRLAARAVDLSPEVVADALRHEGALVGGGAVLDMLDALRRELVGLGPLEDLAKTPGVTDILVNGPDEVFVDDGDGLRRCDVRFDSHDAVRRLGQRLAAVAGRRLDDASPYVDVRLPDGTRLHAVLAPVARTGTCLSLRIPSRGAMPIDALVAAGTLTRDAARVVADIVDARLAFLISGGTGSGKTTLLASLLSLVDPKERIVIVEDSGELAPDHPHVVALESRRANVEGVGDIELHALVRQALRMRPDRLVVGEVRGAEIVDLLAALNTGHDGGCGTIHANAPTDVPARVEALAIAAGLERHAVHAQLAAALHVVLHLARGRDGIRRLHSIAIIGRDAVDRGLVVAEPALTFGATRTLVGSGGARLDELLSGRVR